MIDKKIESCLVDKKIIATVKRGKLLTHSPSASRIVTSAK